MMIIGQEEFEDVASCIEWLYTYHGDTMRLGYSKYELEKATNEEEIKEALRFSLRKVRENKEDYYMDEYKRDDFDEDEDWLEYVEAETAWEELIDELEIEPY
jgi:hypothetical protein